MYHEHKETIQTLESQVVMGLPQHGPTYQSLIDYAENERVMQNDVSWVFRTEADVGDGCVPLQPQRMQSLF